MAGAFQGNAFQTSAFQADPPIPAGYGQACADIKSPWKWGQALGFIAGGLLYDAFNRVESLGSIGVPNKGPAWQAFFQDGLLQAQVNGTELYLDSSLDSYVFISPGSPINVRNSTTYIEFKLEDGAANNYIEFTSRVDLDGFSRVGVWWNGGTDWNIFDDDDLTSFTFALSSNTYYSLKLVVLDNQILVKIWEKGTSEPSSYNGTRTTLQTGLGATAFYIDASASNSDVFIDVYSVQGVETNKSAQAQAIINRALQAGQAQGQVHTPGFGTGWTQGYIQRYLWIYDTFTRETYYRDLGQPDIAGPPYESYLDEPIGFPVFIPENTRVDGEKLTFTSINNDSIDIISIIGAKNVEARFEFTYSEYGSDQIQDFFLRISLDFSIAVEFFIDGGTLQIFSFAPFINTSSEEYFLDPFEDGETYSLRAIVVDQIAKVKVWKKSAGEPTDWQIQHTVLEETLIEGAAYLYLDTGFNDLNPTVYFDNYNVLQLDVVDNTFRVGQVQADIKAVINKHAQAQARILKSAGYGQALADINAVRRAHAQARARITSALQAAQAQADILKTTNRHAQAQAFIRKSAGYGQSQTDIKQTQNKFGQARALIKQGRGFGQAQAWIKKRSWGIGQARGLILKPSAYGQAQATIAGSAQQFGQAQSIINQVLQTGQAQAQLTGIPKNIGQALARIIKYPLVFAQAQSNIKAFIYGSGQAQGQITKTICSGQANCYILNGHAHGQCQGFIFINNFKHGQCQAFINKSQGYGQCQAVIKHSSSGQCQASIAVAKIKTGLALGIIINTTFAIIISQIGQAQAIIRKQVNHGQCQGIIKKSNRSHGQANCLIDRLQRCGQAQARIGNDRYLVSYNEQQLPGYAQSESFNSVSSISDNAVAYIDYSFSEYIGLQNKLISLRFKVIGENLEQNKIEIDKAKTILRSKRSGFSKLVIQRFDRYYLGIVKTITAEHTVETNRVAEYSVDIEAKPWQIGETTHTISGTGTISTVDRTIENGGWSPVRLAITGDNVTISGYTDIESFTGFISVSGSVNNMIINSESYTATIGGVNKNNLMNNLDYAVYVGPGITYFEVIGATECVIEWEDRWYL